MFVRFAAPAVLAAALLTPQSAPAATVEPHSATGCVTKSVSWLLRRQCYILTSPSGVFSVVHPLLRPVPLPEGREVKVNFLDSEKYGLPDLGCGFGTIVGYISHTQTGKKCTK
jgi:hypothetical protein